MASTKKTYRSRRGSTYLITRIERRDDQIISLAPVQFNDGLFTTSDPELQTFIEGLDDFGKGVVLNASAKAKEAKPPRAGSEGKVVIVDSVNTVNDAVEFLSGRGVPKSKITTKKSIIEIAEQMGLKFPNL